MSTSTCMQLDILSSINQQIQPSKNDSNRVSIQSMPLALATFKASIYLSKLAQAKKKLSVAVAIADKNRLHTKVALLSLKLLEIASKLRNRDIDEYQFYCECVKQHPAIKSVKTPIVYTKFTVIKIGNDFDMQMHVSTNEKGKDWKEVFVPENFKLLHDITNDTSNLHQCSSHLTDAFFKWVEIDRSSAGEGYSKDWSDDKLNEEYCKRVAAFVIDVSMSGVFSVEKDEGILLQGKNVDYLTREALLKFGIDVIEEYLTDGCKSLLVTVVSKAKVRVNTDLVEVDLAWPVKKQLQFPLGDIGKQCKKSKIAYTSSLGQILHNHLFAQSETTKKSIGTYDIEGVSLEMLCFESIAHSGIAVLEKSKDKIVVEVNVLFQPTQNENIDIGKACKRGDYFAVRNMLMDKNSKIYCRYIRAAIKGGHSNVVALLVDQKMLTEAEKEGRFISSLGVKNPLITAGKYQREDLYDILMSCETVRATVTVDTITKAAKLGLTSLLERLKVCLEIGE